MACYFRVVHISDLLVKLLCCYGSSYCGIFRDSSKRDLGIAGVREGGGGGLHQQVCIVHVYINQYTAACMAVPHFGCIHKAVSSMNGCGQKVCLACELIAGQRHVKTGLYWVCSST